MFSVTTFRLHADMRGWSKSSCRRKSNAIWRASNAAFGEAALEECAIPLLAEKTINLGDFKLNWRQLNDFTQVAIESMSFRLIASSKYIPKSQLRSNHCS
jgi:hypothetical protein